MTDEATNERVEKGREILKTRAAQGEPGTKQPAHKGPALEAQEVVDELNALTEKHSAEARGPSAGGVQNHPVPPHERSTAPIGGAGIQAAAGALAAARAHIENELISEARLASDPRRELDQKKFEMGQRGELGFVPPAPEELAALGLPPAVADEIPKTPAEQVARDMPRLQQAEETAKQVKGGQSINPTVENAVRDSQIRTGAGKETVGAGKPAATGTGESTPATTAAPETPSTASYSAPKEASGTPIK